MALTPGTIKLAARGGMGVATIGLMVAGGTETGAPPAMLLAGGGWAASLLVLLSFPRVRKNDLLAAVGGCGGIAGFLTTSGGIENAALAALAGIAGPAALALTLSVMRVRHLAAANEHMPFVEWRQLDRRRRSDAELPALPAKPVPIRD